MKYMKGKILGVLGIILFILLVITLPFIFIFILIKFVWACYTKPVSTPVCYWQYTDSFGNVNRASKCKGVYNSIYCGDDNNIHLAVSAERICENE